MDADCVRGILANPQKIIDAYEAGNNLTLISEDTTVHGTKTYLTGNPLGKNCSEETNQSAREHAQFLRNAKKKGKVVTYLPVDILKPEISAQMLAPDDFVHQSFELLLKTHGEMVAHKTKFNGEKAYRTFVDEFLKNEHDWKLFYSAKNGALVWTERSCGIFGNLATIYRQRGCYHQCAEVMVPYKYVIDQYNAMVAARKALALSCDDEIICMSNLTFKYHRIAANLAMNTLCADGMAETYRYLIQYEMDTGVTEDASEFMWMLSALLNKPCTSEALAASTDEEVLQMALLMHAFNVDKIFNHPEVPLVPKESLPPGEVWGGCALLAVCTGCGVQEPFLNTHKLCGRCKAVKYCSKECQVAHYKAHKESCKAAIAAKEKK